MSTPKPLAEEAGPIERPSGSAIVSSRVVSKPGAMVTETEYTLSAAAKEALQTTGRIPPYHPVSAPTELDAEVEALAGEDFMARLRAAVQRPAWPESVMEALSEGPEICGGYDAGPDDATAGIASEFTMPVELRRPGRVVTKLREMSHLKIGELAEQSNISPEDVAAIEAGDLRPTQQQTDALALVLGAHTLASIFTEEPNE